MCGFPDVLVVYQVDDYIVSAYGLTDIIDTLTSIKEDFDNPANNDAFYGTVECLLDELDALITNYKETRESENPF